MNILLTGGAGYIGSHTCVELLTAGHSVVIVDDLSNSSKRAVERLEQLTKTPIPFYEVDLLDTQKLVSVFEKHSFDAVIHFAGLKAVGESVVNPLLYYKTNVGSTITLLEVMKQFGVDSIVFSSSATVYGDPISVPIREDFKLQTTNPYGETKLAIENMLRAVATANSHFKVSLLRYFNPVGAHKSGLIGEDPKGIPNNLVPYIAQVAGGRRQKLSVYGDDYNTPDGTGVRDYIHVVDLARGHVCAVEQLFQSAGCVHTYNLGTNKGTSVLEMISAFEKASGQKIPFQVVSRRAGDIAQCYADATLAKDELNWVATKSVQEMCEDTWRWQSQNPRGYE